MSELKPCPFCGGKADMVQPGTRRHSCIVECLNCGCRLESSDEGERSGQSWNSRAEAGEGARREQ
jgi:Lar family restriction alleviation protein